MVVRQTMLFLITLAQLPSVPPIEPVVISGFVLQPDDKPAPNARITFIAEPPFGKGDHIRRETLCDGQGRLRIRLPRPSDWQAYLIAYKPGFGVGWTKITPTASASVTVRLTKPAKLTGRVKGIKGNAVLVIMGLRPQGLFSPIRSSLSLSRMALDIFQTSTDSDGRFALTDLPDGMIATVIVERWLDPWQTQAIVYRFEVPITDGVMLTFPPTGIVEGVVIRRRDKMPLTNVTVQLEPVGANSRSPLQTAMPLPIGAATNEQGRFRAVVPVGKWLVWLPASGDAEWMSMPQVVNVRENETVKVVVAAQRPGIVRGWVADAKTRFPLTRLFVRARLLQPISDPLSPIPILSDVAQQVPEGAYEIHLPDGTWELFVADDGWQSEPVTMEVAEGTVLEAPFIFARAYPSVRVTVTDEKGKPMKAWLADGLGNMGETDERGETQWTLPPHRSVRLIASSPDLRSWAVMPLMAEQSLARFPLQPGISVSGMIVNRVEQPVVGALVSLWARWHADEPPVCLLTQCTDEQGGFRFPVPSDCSVQVRAQKGQTFVQTDWLMANVTLQPLRLVLK